MRKMIDILFEAYPGQGDTNEIHIFDFDETLALTSSSTLHVGFSNHSGDFVPT